MSTPEMSASACRAADPLRPPRQRVEAGVLAETRKLVRLQESRRKLLKKLNEKDEQIRMQKLVVRSMVSDIVEPITLTNSLNSTPAPRPHTDEVP